MDKSNALERVRRASRARDQAVDRFAEALHDAHEAGASWTEIAKAAGKSQPSVFTFAQRHPRNST